VLLSVLGMTTVERVEEAVAAALRWGCTKQIASLGKANRKDGHRCARTKMSAELPVETTS
jgi:hypothetical protein